jgi:hypothetical protein
LETLPWWRTYHGPPKSQKTQHALSRVASIARTRAQIYFEAPNAPEAAIYRKTVYCVAAKPAGPSGFSWNRVILIPDSDQIALAAAGNALISDECGPIHFRVPGSFHGRGWDAWSVGPNGIDEQGAGDDILIGEDVADVTSR